MAITAMTGAVRNSPLYFFFLLRPLIIVVLIIQLVTLAVQLIMLASVSTQKKAPIMLSHKVTDRATQGDEPADTTPNQLYLIHLHNAGRVRTIYGDSVSIMISDSPHISTRETSILGLRRSASILTLLVIDRRHEERREQRHPTAHTPGTYLFHLTSARISVQLIYIKVF